MIIVFARGIRIMQLVKSHYFWQPKDGVSPCPDRAEPLTFSGVGYRVVG